MTEGLKAAEGSSLSSDVFSSSVRTAIGQFILMKSIFHLLSVKDISVFNRGGRIETGTGLAGIEFAVPHDTRLGIDLMQEREDLVKDDHLLGCAVVLVLVLGTAGVTALVADANRKPVVPFHMAAYLFHRTAIIETTVPTHIEMIARVIAELLCPMAGSKLLEGEVLVRPRVGAVEHQQVNPPR